MTATDEPKPPRGHSLSTPHVVLGAGAGALVAVLVVSWLTGWISTGEALWFGGIESDELFDIVRSAVTTVGVLGIAIAGALAYQRQRLGESEHEQQLVRDQLERDRDEDARAQDEAARERDLRDYRAGVVTALRSRFTTAASQLGDDSLSVRIAGVYAMAGIADEWLTLEDQPGVTREAQVCVDVLCAYLRTQLIDTSRPHIETETSESPPWDVEIRQTIVRVVADHYRDDPTISWTDLDLDFTGAIFNGLYDFRRCHFTKSLVKFTGAEWRGGLMTFSDAKFSGGYLDFTAARLSAGRVSFDQSRFSSSQVNFGGTWFVGGEVNFGGARFVGGEVRFDETRFAGSRVDFEEALFGRSGRVVFFHAEFSGSDLDFRTADFAGGTVEFQKPKFSGGTVSGPWGRDDPPNHWPESP